MLEYRYKLKYGGWQITRPTEASGSPVLRASVALETCGLGPISFRPPKQDAISLTLAAKTSMAGSGLRSGSRNIRPRPLLALDSCLMHEARATRRKVRRFSAIVCEEYSL